VTAGRAAGLVVTVEPPVVVRAVLPLGVRAVRLVVAMTVRPGVMPVSRAVAQVAPAGVGTEVRRRDAARPELAAARRRRVRRQAREVTGG
jgi:hypothetical protein